MRIKYFCSEKERTKTKKRMKEKRDRDRERRLRQSEKSFNFFEILFYLNLLLVTSFSNSHNTSSQFFKARRFLSTFPFDVSF